MYSLQDFKEFQARSVWFIIRLSSEIKLYCNTKNTHDSPSKCQNTMQ